LIRSLLVDERDGKTPTHVKDVVRKGQTPQSLYDFVYGLDYLRPRYSLGIAGKSLSELSPGERGALLLVFYLLIDQNEVPLVIDQPEENLDPKSIFDELVELFIAAKNVRQVIMVTHNANLVINTDADQVIVAFSGIHNPGKLPPIRYLSGGLENADMRLYVCDILEGGERAFKERARRLRVRLDR
jgi:ABC-type Mn2+/Zn2+ transport system ATPase subunit